MVQRYYMYETKIDADGYMELDKDGCPIIYRTCVILGRNKPGNNMYPVSNEQWREDCKKAETFIPAERFDINKLKEDRLNDILKRVRDDELVGGNKKTVSRSTKAKRTTIRRNDKDTKNVPRRGRKRVAKK